MTHLEELTTPDDPQYFVCRVNYSSDRENYFWRAGQNVLQAFSALPDILSPCQTFFPVDGW